MLTKEELDTYKPWLISVALTGSSTLPWITNPHDTDYVCFVTDNHLSGWCYEFLKNKPKEECWFIKELNQPPMLLYAYEYHFLKPVYGEEFLTCDVLEDIPKYKDVLIKCGSCDFDPRSKQWYHILTGIYLIQNGKYELTEEQAQAVQACHDKQMTIEIYNYIQEQLSKYRKELEGTSNL